MQWSSAVVIWGPNQAKALGGHGHRIAPFTKCSLIPPPTHREVVEAQGHEPLPI